MSFFYLADPDLDLDLELSKQGLLSHLLRIINIRYIRFSTCIRLSLQGIIIFLLTF